MEKTVKITRKTKETSISVEFGLGPYCGENVIASGVPFFDHMLAAFARHGRFYLNLQCTGDLQVDAHHTMEDIGLALGQAGKNALGDKRGITRFGAAAVPLDESLARVVVDLSGRPYLAWRAIFPEDLVAGISCRLFREFFQAWVNTSGTTLHVDLLFCEENHHGLEAIFKSFGRALRQAVTPDPTLGEEIPSTKGILA
ncbi:MAG: imidazoleglycerol-phosphate dehydratase HisB [Lentisphaerae bacterium]|nr:imidazoleglycerol-phosphate dehydratase HisB [Lentisphaerota bacterium]